MSNIVTPGLNISGIASCMSRKGVWMSFLLLGLTFVAHGELVAQEIVQDPNDRFDYLLDEGYSVDDARQIVAKEYSDNAVAADIAVYICSPPADEKCRGSDGRRSDVFEAWYQFLRRIEDGQSASTAAYDMQENFDSYLSYGIAVDWCAPDPLEGCEDDPITGAWYEFFDRLEGDSNPARAISWISQRNPLVAELIAASECGERTCYSEYIAVLEFEEHTEEDRPRSQPRPQPNSGGLQFGFKPEIEEPALLARICATERARKEVARCKAK